jgi:hypothetical protein
MLQKRLEDRQPGLYAIQHEGQFFAQHDPLIANSILDGQGPLFGDLLNICLLAPIQN